MNRFNIILLVVFSCLCGMLHGQLYADKTYYLVDSLNLSELTEEDRQLVDSCLKAFYAAKDDTSKINAISYIVLESWNENVYPKYNWWLYEFALELLNNNLPAKETRVVQYALAGAINNIGVIYNSQGNIPQALEYFHKSLKVFEELDDKHGMASSYNNLGTMYENQGDIPQALDYLHKSLKLKEELDDKGGMATTYNNIGYIYRDQGDPSITSSKDESLRVGAAKGLDYFYKGLIVFEELGDKKGIATCYNNIGIIYDKVGDPSITSSKEESHKAGKAKALENFNKSLKLDEELGDKEGMAYSYNSLGNLMLEQSSLSEAMQYAQKGLKLAQEIGYPSNISNNSMLVSKIAKKQGNYLEALEMYELHILMRDSINNEENQKAAIRQQTKYEFEKDQLVKEQEAKEILRLQDEMTSRRDNLQYSIILVGILVVFGLVMSLGVISVSPKVAEGMIFFAFLIFFEFLLVLSDPYLDSVTGGAPAYKLLANALLAALIFPAHAFFESFLKKKLIDNKRKA